MIPFAAALRPALPALAALAMTGSLAAAADDCFLADDLSDLKGVARIVGEGRAAFGASPDKAAVCVGKCAYVLPGDVVALGAAKDGATCVGFTGAGGRQTFGWLPTQRLGPYAPAIADWAGFWGDKDRYLSIRVEGGDLVIDAKMTYQGAGPVFSGAFHGKAAPVGGAVTLANDFKGRQIDPAKAQQDACKAKLVLAGAALLVHDEGCVGAGSAANFDGAYTRRKN